jgi:hypothetical protein
MIRLQLGKKTINTFLISQNNRLLETKIIIIKHFKSDPYCEMAEYFHWHKLKWAGISYSQKPHFFSCSCLATEYHQQHTRMVHRNFGEDSQQLGQFSIIHNEDNSP